jgi:hypothetical protein
MRASTLDPQIGKGTCLEELEEKSRSYESWQGEKRCSQEGSTW